MKYISLFTGIGGFELGIQQAYELLKMGIKPEDSTNSPSTTSQYTERPLCIGYSEIDKYAIQIYQKHFPNHTNFGDITKINADELPDFDFLCGGFPCQAFSIAGKRRGFEDTRGTLFFDIARILQAKKPRLLLLENVKGLLSHDNGQTFSTIIATLDELGYDLQWQVLNSKNFGVPQNRERVFIVGHLRGTRRPEVFPFGTSGFVSHGKLKVIRNSPYDTDRLYDPKGLARTMRANAGGKGAKTGLYMVDDPSRKKGIVDKNISPTLRREAHGNLPAVLQDMKIRRLTPLECERLQGFPDNWTQVGIEYPIDEYYKDEHKILKREVKISDTQRYKMCGNAVTVNVIQAIMQKILQSV